MPTRLPRRLAVMATGVAFALMAPTAGATTTPDVAATTAPDAAETARQQVAQLGAEVEAAAAEYRDVEVRLAAQQNQVAAAEARVASQAALVASLKEQVVALAVETYKSGGVDPQLSLLAGGTGLADSTQMLGIIAERRAVTLGDVRDAQVELQRLRDAAVTELRGVEAMQADLTRRRADIEARLAGAKDVLVAAEAEVQRQLALDEARRAVEAAEASRNGSSPGDPLSAASDVPLPGSDGLLTTPTPGRQSAYGWRIHPVYGVRKFHSGMDIMIGCGTPVVAAADGVVESAKWDGSYGNIIVVRHGVAPVGDLSTAYAHLTEFAVTSGVVTKGQVIGYVGTTGLSTGCHLHFEVRVGGADVDPARFI